MNTSLCDSQRRGCNVSVQPLGGAIFIAEISRYLTEPMASSARPLCVNLSTEQDNFLLTYHKQCFGLSLNIMKYFTFNKVLFSFIHIQLSLKMEKLLKYCISICIEFFLTD